MINRYTLAMSVTLVATGLVAIHQTALAESPNIISFDNSGKLTWINSDTNLFYRVEWASTLMDPDGWHSNYTFLTDIRSSDSIVTSSVPMYYRVCGNSNRLVSALPIPKTGQTKSYRTGDDGSYQKGVAWPNPRFTVQTDTNCVLDNLTGLMWARNANLSGKMTWDEAIDYCEALNYGGHNDWRLPNIREHYSLSDNDYFNPALCNTSGPGHWTTNDPFTNVQFDHYWASSTVPADAGSAWRWDGSHGYQDSDAKTSRWYVWPVRGGQ